MTNLEILNFLSKNINVLVGMEKRERRLKAGKGVERHVTSATQKKNLHDNRSQK